MELLPENLMVWGYFGVVLDGFFYVKVSENSSYSSERMFLPSSS